MSRTVRAIPATLNRFTLAPIHTTTKRKVAGYARVSTELEEQQSSYAAQMDYYQAYISGRPDWEFVGMYSDEGITATNTQHRDGFNRMIADALAGKIDLIVTKSISRFARNTVDSLTTIRKLKEHGTEVYFEKENIWTLDSKGELLITIMSSLAQEESRSISENTAWGRRKSFADGNVTLGYSSFLGYDRGFVINEAEAEIVRLIYQLYLDGLSIYAIGKELERRGYKSPTCKDTWHIQTIRSILSNEKYRGDALLQKRFTVDFLQKKSKKNEGELPQYYVEGHHEPIIPPAVFEIVQLKRKQRAKDGKNYSGASVFASKIICGDCGSMYGRKVWHSTERNRKYVFTCNRRFENNCTTQHVYETDLHRLYLEAVNSMIRDKANVLKEMEQRLKAASDTSALMNERQQLEQDVQELERTMNSLSQENARVALDQSEFSQQYRELYVTAQEKHARLTEIATEIREHVAQAEMIRQFVQQLTDMADEQTVFDEQQWAHMIDHVTVYTKARIVFTFLGGYEVERELPQKRTYRT